MTARRGLRRGLLAAAALASLAAASAARAQSGANVDQACAAAQTASGPPNSSEGVGFWPKFSFETIAALEYGGIWPKDGPGRGPDLKLWFDSTFIAQINENLSFDGLFQFKPRQPLSATDLNQQLFINQAPGLQEGGKMKELFVRYGNYRFGKFVPDFGRAYNLMPGFQAQDFVAEAEQGYEPAEMTGVEWIHIFPNENGGWRQLSVSAVMVDRT